MENDDIIIPKDTNQVENSASENSVQSEKMSEAKKQKLTKGVLLLVFLMVLEATVFNFRFYQNMFNEPISFKDCMYNTGAVEKKDGLYNMTSDEESFEIYNINKHINNLYLDFEIPEELKNDRNNHAIAIGISATDKGNSQYFDLPNRIINTDLKRSKYISLNLNGESSKIKIKIYNFKDKDLIINNIVLNGKIPFTFNIFRIAFLYGVITLVNLLRVKKGHYKELFNSESKSQRAVLYRIIIINILAFMFLGVINPDYYPTKSHQYQYYRLAEALLNGHFYLNDAPPAALIMVDNPYDPDMRREAVNKAGSSFKWDTAYRNGKYYVYFGIVPCLLYYLPLKALGLELANKYYLMIVISIIIIFGYLLLYEINRRWFKNISFLAHTMLSVIFVNSTGIILAIRATDLYHLPIMSSMMFLIMTFYFWIKALPDNKGGTLKGGYLTAGSVTMALVSGCRPQLLLMMFVAIPLFGKYVFKERTLFSKNSVKKTLGFVLPFVVFGSFMMYYNYARFGSVFNFGQDYNLTVMDMTSERFNIEKLPLGLFTYFLQIPGTSVIFPYIHYAGTNTQFMGNYVMEEVTGGMFIHHILLFSLLLIFRVKNELKEKGLWGFTLLILAVSLIVCMIDFNTGGIVERYRTDFTWPIFLGAVIVIYALLEKYGKTPFYGLILTVLSVCFMWSFVNDFAELFNATYKTYSLTCPAFFYNMKYIIEFWL